MKRLLLISLLFSITVPILCQSNAESSSFKFLNIASSARHNYLGKAAIATFDPEMDVALANPALIQYHTRGKVLASSALYFTSLYGNLAFAGNNSKYDIPFVAGVNFLSYGKQTRTDNNGNILGDFNPNEMSVYLAASKTYKHYSFGLTTKFAYGNYYAATIAGLATDFSMLYRDVNREIYVTILLKNIGYQFVAQNTKQSPMPFDVQLGFSKKLKHLPFRFSVMAQEIYALRTVNTDVEYGVWPLDPYYARGEMSLPESILSKLVFGGEFYLGKSIRFGASYDVKKSIEGRFEQFRGLQGLALGFGIYARKYDFGYSYSRLTPISVSHQFTVALHLDEIIRR